MILEDYPSKHNAMHKFNSILYFFNVSTMALVNDIASNERNEIKSSKNSWTKQFVDVVLSLSITRSTIDICSWPATSRLSSANNA